MTTVDRFRVRKADHVWTYAGPDLLRPRVNAKRQAATLMGDRLSGWYTRKAKTDGTKTDWVGPTSKHDTLDVFGSATFAGVDFVFGYAAKGETPTAVVVARLEKVTLLPLANCSPNTILNHSLVEHQFPRVIFSGGYDYRQIAGSTDWSDHAWGTAFDETEHLPDTTNDEVFDWTARMARAGCMDFDYTLGSRNDNVVSCGAPDFEVVPSGASRSHLWHIHQSVVDHSGQKPPREGGVW